MWLNFIIHFIKNQLSSGDTIKGVTLISSNIECYIERVGRFYLYASTSVQTECGKFTINAVNAWMS